MNRDPKDNNATVTSTSSSSSSGVVRFTKGKFACSECKRKYKTKGGLNLHIKSHRPDQFLLQCSQCNFSTFQKCNLAKHMSVRHRKNLDGNILQEDFSCDSCHYKCVTEAQLKTHIARKHTSSFEKDFPCCHCDYATVSKADLHKHIRIRHTDQRPYTCDYCGYKAHTASAMARHKRGHLQVKPYSCPICPVSYADKKRLTDHMMKHTNIKPFTCTSCTYATNRKDNLKTHIKRNHMPPPSWTGVNLSMSSFANDNDDDCEGESSLKLLPNPNLWMH